MQIIVSLFKTKAMGQGQYWYTVMEPSYYNSFLGNIFFYIGDGLKSQNIIPFTNGWTDVHTN